jgi:hypothetical protein
MVDMFSLRRLNLNAPAAELPKSDIYLTAKLVGRPRSSLCADFLILVGAGCAGQKYLRSAV